MTQPRLPQLSSVLVHLLKGVLYREHLPVVWDDCLRLQAEVLDYMKHIGLELCINEAEGFAYLKQMPVDEEDVDGIPRLIQRRPLSYPLSLLCVLLRKKLVESEAGGEQVRLVMTHDQITDMIQIFLENGPNEVSMQQHIDACINKLEGFGFLRLLKSSAGPPAYEVRRIIKTLVDADWLSDFDQKLKEYKDHGNRTA